MSGPRYALYFAPEEDSALARFGWGWLGRQAGDTMLRELPPTGLTPQRQAEIVADSQRYGFHATLKPPFHLAEGMSLSDLCATAQSFAAARPGFVAPPLALAELNGFLALRLAQPSAAIASLADDCVRHFDSFRAPAGEAERRKRLAVPLTERQKRYIDLWGYPYVFEEFRFHMSLTCRLGEAEQALCLASLRGLAAMALAEPVAFRSLSLFAQATTSAPFVLLHRFAFAGS